MQRSYGNASESMLTHSCMQACASCMHACCPVSRSMSTSFTFLRMLPTHWVHFAVTCLLPPPPPPRYPMDPQRLVFPPVPCGILMYFMYHVMHLLLPPPMALALFGSFGLGGSMHDPTWIQSGSTQGPRMIQPGSIQDPHRVHVWFNLDPDRIHA